MGQTRTGTLAAVDTALDGLAPVLAIAQAAFPLGIEKPPHKQRSGSDSPVA